MKAFHKIESAIVSVATVAAVAASVRILWIRRVRKRRTNHDQGNEELISHELLNVERLFYGRNDPPIRTLTWFQGDYHKAGSILRYRVKLILEKNPWLGGSLERRLGKLWLTYSKTEPWELDNHFVIIEPDNSTLSRDMPIDQLGKAAKKFLSMNEASEPLFRVSVVPCRANPETNFALIVQLSHIIGDGSTFYQIHNMLCSIDAMTIAELIPDRILTTGKQQVLAMGQAEYDFMTTLPYFLNCIGGLIWTKTFGSPHQSRFFSVDDARMRQAKRDAAKGVPFVSTNDVITSWFLQESKCTHGLMLINFRNRLEGHADRHAGNYENCLFYRLEDSATPGLIRQSLSSFRRTITTSSMPSFWKVLFSSTAIVTNWSSFAKPAVIEGCQEDLHVPLYDIATMIPSTIAILIIFRSGPRGLALYAYGQPRRLEGLRSASFLSENTLE